MLSSENSPGQKEQVKSNKEHGGELLDKYLKPHTSESTTNSTVKGISGQQVGSSDKHNSGNTLGQLSYIPTFSERELRVYQKLGEGKSTSFDL